MKSIESLNVIDNIKQMDFSIHHFTFSILFLILLLPLDIKQHYEKSLKIKGIYIYPVEGIRGCRMNSCEITPYGLKGDRNWVIVDKEDMKLIACHNSHIITFLRQRVNPEGPNEVRLFF